MRRFSNTTHAQAHDAVVWKTSIMSFVIRLALMSVTRAFHTQCTVNFKIHRYLVHLTEQPWQLKFT